MKKSLILIVSLFLILFLSFQVLAANDTESRAFACLEGKVQSKCSTLTFEQQMFSLLALSYKSSIQTECKNSLIALSKDSECWPKDSCKIKETAQAIIALNNLGVNTAKAENWILNRSRTPSEIEWYLEIDSSQATQCTLNGNTISINADKLISGSLSTCFSLANDNYWIRIDNACLKNSINISCDKDFISTILYKKPNSIVWHVSSDVKQSSANGKTEHQIISSCIGLTSCDYEGSLWASLALQKANREISQFLPYLTAIAEDNSKLFPYSFLNVLASSDEYLQQIILLQSTLGFWDLNEKGKYYDTSLGLISLSESDAKSKAMDWLATNQGTDGCWNSGSIRDTAMILWAAWPKQPATIESAPSVSNCEDFNYSCISNSECADAGGSKLTNFWCSSPRICCTKSAIVASCSDRGGEECSTNKVCSTSTVETPDVTECCLGTCDDTQSACDLASKYCLDECGSGQTQSSESCNGGKICCEQKQSSSLWIWILVILIILVVLGIIFRNKLKLWFSQITNKSSKTPIVKTRPPFPQMSPIPAQRYAPRPMSRPTQQPQSRTREDKELDETMRKLKEMSK